MKSFIMNKKESYYRENFQTHKIKVDIQEDDEFNNISIVNPKDSNSVYIIDCMRLQCENNELNLIIGEKTKVKNDAKLVGDFYIEYSDINHDKENTIYIDTIDKKEKNKVDVLKKQFLILLPKGYVCIKVVKPMKKATLELEWRKVNI